MKTRLLLNLVLACVAAALVLVVVFEPGKEKTQSSPLTQIDESGVNAFTLQSPRETLVFERKDGRWWIKSPLTAPANEIRIRQLLEVAKSGIDAQYPLNKEELAKYELDPPSATLLIGEVTIRFGGSDPIDMRRYVQVGDTLFLIRDDFSHHLNAGATDYINKKLLPEEAKIASIALPGLKAKLSPEGQWTMEPAAADPAAAATALSNAWQSARAIEVKRMEKPARGDHIRIGLADGSAAEFVILQREPELILARANWGIQYEMVGEIAKQLLNQPIPEDENKPAGSEDDHRDDAGKDSGGETEQLITDPDAGEGEELD